ncbi:MAG: hypothetical protein IAE79_09535 [Anaerolinea sp.]|nr:hypothetical protein [Anaerolinea sp.]
MKKNSGDEALTTPLCSGEFCAIAYYGFFSSGQRARLRPVAAWLKPPAAQPNLDKPEKNLTQRHKEAKRQRRKPFAPLR